MSRHHPIYGRGWWVALCALGLVLTGVTGCGPKPAPPASPAKPKVAATATNAAALTSTNVSDEYTSVFEELPTPKGRDPFFPYSHRRDPVPVAAAPANGAGAEEVRPDAVLVLKAILHTRKHSQAVINNEILEQGEEGQVRVPNGKVRVRCLEIGTDYVTVQVEGDPGPKRLTMSKKND